MFSQASRRSQVICRSWKTSPQTRVPRWHLRSQMSYDKEDDRHQWTHLNIGLNVNTTPCHLGTCQTPGLLSLCQGSPWPSAWLTWFQGSCRVVSLGSLCDIFGIVWHTSRRWALGRRSCQSGTSEGKYEYFFSIVDFNHFTCIFVSYIDPSSSKSLRFQQLRHLLSAPGHFTCRHRYWISYFRGLSHTPQLFFSTFSQVIIRYTTQGY